MLGLVARLRAGSTTEFKSRSIHSSGTKAVNYEPLRD